jgi:hypothetical protein
MSETITVGTGQLSGTALDWAVAQCEEVAWQKYDELLYSDKATGPRPSEFLRDYEFSPEGFKPSTDWAQGGPIITRMMSAGLRLTGYTRSLPTDPTACQAQIRGVVTGGTTPLIAAMRCYVEINFGAYVKVPTEFASPSGEKSDISTETQNIMNPTKSKELTMTTVSTEELDGAALDWAVATAQGRKEIKIYAPMRETDKGWIEVRFNPEPRASTARFDPSSDWSYGGPIIEREKINPEWMPKSGVWMANSEKQRNPTEGETPLIAAMRCFVLQTLGPQVDVPDSLAKRYAKPASKGPSL